MSVRVSCPYCNTGFALAAVPPTGRATCPRCGDTFSVRAAGEQAGGEPEPVAPVMAAAPPVPRRSWVVPVALLVVVAGVGVALVGSGRKPEPPPEPDAAPTAAVTPPAELRGLDYLPATANVAVAVQPGPVLAYAARTNQDPVELLTRNRVPASVLGALGRAGVTLPQIDHVAAAAHVPDTDLGELRFALILVLRRPVADEAAFLDRLPATRGAKGGAERYDVDLGGFPLRLAKVADTVWVFGKEDRDLDGGGLPPGFRDLLRRKVPADAAVWAAADDAAWADKKPVALLLGLGGGRKEWLPALAKGRAAAVGLSLGGAPELRAAVRCADAATAAKVGEYFRRKGAGVYAGEWADLGVPVDPRAGFATLRELFDDAGKE